MKIKTFFTIVIAFGLLVPQATYVADLDDLRRQVEQLEEIALELELKVIEKFGYPRIDRIIPETAELGEPVVIKGRRFTGPVTVFFNSYVAFPQIDPVNEETIAFRVPEMLGQPTNCSETLQGATICTRLEFPVATQTQEYEVRVQNSRGTSALQRLEIK